MKAGDHATATGEAVRARRSCAQIEALILSQISRAGRPVTAYRLVSELQASGVRISPNQVYRTLARLIADGRVQRLETLAAYVLQRNAVDAFLICDTCQHVAAVGAAGLKRGLAAHADACSFAPQRYIVETRGTCAECLKRLPGPLRI